jgi:hypothetical protein
LQAINALLFFHLPWTAFVQPTLVSCPKKMNISDAIFGLHQVLRRQHKALSTEKCYAFWLRRYIEALRQMPPELSSEQKLERENVSASTQNQAFNAILFFYREVLGQAIGNVDALRVQRPVHERHVICASHFRFNDQGLKTNDPPVPDQRLLAKISVPQIRFGTLICAHPR